MKIVNAVHTSELWGSFSDRMVLLHQADNTDLDAEPRSDLVQMRNDDGSTTQATYQIFSLGRGHGMQYISRDLDAQGKTQRTEFAFGYSYPDGDEFEVTAGAFDRQADGTFEGQAVVGIPGFENNVGPTMLHVPDAKPLIPHALENDINHAGYLLADRFADGPAGDGSTFEPNSGVLEFDPQEATQAAQALDAQIADLFKDPAVAASTAQQTPMLRALRVTPTGFPDGGSRAS